MANFGKTDPMDDSVNLLLVGLKRADAYAIADLWKSYFGKLVLLARQRMVGVQKTVVDEEDVALSVFNSLCCRAERGEFHTLEDRNDLWRILVTLTQAKAADAIRWTRRLKRKGTGLTRICLERAPSDDPSPESLAILVEQQQHLMSKLPDEACRKIALKKLEGETDTEIAKALDIADRTVRRKMKLIRAIWKAEMDRDEA